MSAHISGGYAVEPPTYGKVLLHTTVGDIDIELWPKQAPKACRNFVQLAMEEYYNDCIFHRVIPNFMVQTGDPTNTGDGGESIYGIAFKDEFHSRLKFSHRGIVAMANSGKNENQSQFFITLDKAPWLDRKHTIFGKVTGNTMYNLLKFNDLQIENDRPVLPQKIKSIEILLSPFDDIQPRLTRTQKLKIEQEERKKEKLNKENQLKQLGAKNDAKLLAFGDDEDSEQDEFEDDEFSKQERQQLIETTNKLKAAKERRKQSEMEEEKQLTDSNSSSSNTAAATTKRKKRTFSEMNENGTEEDKDDGLKKPKTNQEIHDEYELLKRKLLEKQQQNQADYDDDDDDDEDETHEDTMDGAAKLIQQREEYVRKTRMNKVQRVKYTMSKLNEFIEIIDKQSTPTETAEVTTNNKRKGKLDENTGIEFESDSEQEDEDYDPNWFQSKLEFKKRPQDADIYSVDDYETIYGNSTQDTESKRDKRKQSEHYRESDKNRNRNRDRERGRHRDQYRDRGRHRNDYRR